MKYFVKMETLKNELERAYDVLNFAIAKQKKLEDEWAMREAYLKSQNETLNQALSQLDSELKVLKDKYQGCDDKIAALRSVARALECENELLTCEKDNLERFKKKFTHDNGTLVVAVDQIDSLRRQLATKEEELKEFNRQFEYQEIEKIKIVQTLAQVQQDLDFKTHELMKVKGNLSNKEDTLEVCRMYLFVVPFFNLNFSRLCDQPSETLRYAFKTKWSRTLICKIISANPKEHTNNWKRYKPNWYYKKVCTTPK